MNSSSIICIEGDAMLIAKKDAIEKSQKVRSYMVGGVRCEDTHDGRYLLPGTRRLFLGYIIVMQKMALYCVLSWGGRGALTTSNGKMCSWYYGLLLDQFKYTSSVHCCSFLIHGPGGARGDG